MTACSVLSAGAPSRNTRKGGCSMLQFRVGDKAVYPTQGVAEIVGIEEKEISGNTVRFYSLRLIDSGLRILVPVDKAENVGLRAVVDEGQIREVFEILAEKDIPL